jgi:hypothetical protein
MKYIKTSETLKSEADVAYQKRMELQEFANDCLAYLIDDEWSVSVWGFTTSFKIVLLSPRSVKRNRVHHDDAFRDFPLYTVVNDTLFGSYSYEPSLYSVGIMIKEKR